MKRRKATFDELIDKLRERVKISGLKNTAQREVIMRAMYKHEGHHTPEEVLSLTQKEEDGHNIGIATVYRTLNFFEQEGFVVSISFGADGKRYELNTKAHHDHMICVDCGKIIEFESDEIEKLQNAEAKKKDFHIIDHDMQLYGICSDCRHTSQQRKNVTGCLTTNTQNRE